MFKRTVPPGVNKPFVFAAKLAAWDKQEISNGGSLIEALAIKIAIFLLNWVAHLSAIHIGSPSKGFSMSLLISGYKF